MQYSELAVYAGTKISCDYCGKPFRVGQVIHSGIENDLVFCEADPDGPSLFMPNYLFMRFFEETPADQSLSVGYQVFQRHLTSEEFKVLRQHPPSLWQRIKEGFVEYWTGQ